MKKQLETVAQEFTTWRKNREKRTHTPQSLIKRAVSLRAHFSDAEIVKNLKINQTALARWANQSDDNAAEAFIEFPASPVAATLNIANNDRGTQSSLNIALSSGASLSLSGGTGVLAEFVAQLAQRGML